MSQPTSEELEAARGYENLFVPAIFQPWVPHLLSAAGIGPGQQVVDVACGTGVLTRAAAAAVGDGGRVSGVDPAPGMLGAAAELAPEVSWLLSTAEDLPLEDNTVDAIVSQFGLMFFSNLPAALGEMLRVLKPGGRLAFAIWNKVEDNPAYMEVIRLLDERIGKAAGDALRLPYSMGDATPVLRELSDAGFVGIEHAVVGEYGTFPSASVMVEAELRGWLPLFDILLSEDEIAAVLAEASERLSQYVASTGEVVFPMSAHVVQAAKT